MAALQRMVVRYLVTNRTMPSAWRVCAPRRSRLFLPLTSPLMSTEHRYDPQPDRAQVAGGLGARAHLGGVQRRRRRRPSSYVLEMLPYPSRRAAHGPPEELLGRRRGRALPPPQRHARAAPDGLRRVRPAGREPRDQDRRSTRASRPRSRSRRSSAQFRAVGHLDRLVARVRHPRAALLPLDAVDLPAAVRARAGLPQGGGGQLVPEGPDRARQRAGHRRPLRALRHAVEAAPARAVVLPHHRLRRPPARRPRRRSTGPQHVETMQRNWIGRSEGAEVDVLAARRSASTTRSSPRGRTRCSARRSS